MELAAKALRQAAQHLPPGKMTLGLPFYARHVRTGDWVSYEDIAGRVVAAAAVAAKTRGRGGGDDDDDDDDDDAEVAAAAAPTTALAVLDPKVDKIGDDYFNGASTIRAKTRLAVWEPACGGCVPPPCVRAHVLRA